MLSDAELNAMLFDIVRAMGGDWTSADLVQRMTRNRFEDRSQAPSLALVARRLPRIEGLERTVYDGHWVYRIASEVPRPDAHNPQGTAA